MTQSDDSGSPFLRRLFQESRRAANIAFADLDDLKAHADFQSGKFRSAQLEALYSTLPLFVLSHIIIATTLSTIATNRMHLPLAGWWFAAAYVPVFLLFVLWSRHDRKNGQREASRWEIRWIEILACLFGVVWAGCPAIFFTAMDGNLKTLMVAVVLAASAVGTFAFSRIPTAAILYCSLVTSSMAISGTTLGGPIGITFAIFTMTYGLVLNGLVLNMHREQIQREISAIEARKQSEIITLLLNDFEDGTSDWLWETDSRGILTYASSRFSEVSGRSQKELLTLTLPQVAEADMADQGWQQFLNTMKARQPLINCELEVQRGGLTHYWSVNAKPTYTHDQKFKGYRGVGRDVTAEHEIGKKLLAAKEAAEAANAAKTQFLAVMSHELRTPLNSIVGFSEILASRQEDEPVNEMTQDYANTILESSRHLQTLINDILDATRIENGSITLVEQEIDAAEIIEIAVKMCRDQAEKADVTLVAKLVNDVELKADITRIKQVVLNIVTNGIKFSPAGAIVNIEMAKSASGGFVLLVRDGGIGVRPEDMERIFEPFVQVEDNIARRFAGIGLGLSIARKIARLHGGDVTLESQFGSGTTVRFELPPGRVSWISASPAAGVAA
jgi:hypothetical protein